MKIENRALKYKKLMVLSRLTLYKYGLQCFISGFALFSAKYLCVLFSLKPVAREIKSFKNEKL
jgi:hypothetical protein